VSLIFPGSFHPAAGVESRPVQPADGFLALISFAAFWFAYAAGALLLSYERKGRARGRPGGAVRAAGRSETTPPQALACLEGKWWKELTPADGEKKVPRSRFPN